MPSTPDPAWNSRVRTCDNLIGRINFIWKVKGAPASGPARPSTLNLHPVELQPVFHGARPSTYFRVSFGIPSPYFDHWAVYRQHEVTVITALDADPAVKKSIVNSLRPKIPKR
jgi:hypothetical protein